MLGILLVASCRSIPTQALVHRFEGQLFRHCRIEVGWYAGELAKECGAPSRAFASANDSGEWCVAYETDARPLYAGEATAATIVVCLAPGALRGRPVAIPEGVDLGRPAEELAAFRVTGVYGLSPRGATETTRTRADPPGRTADSPSP